MSDVQDEPGSPGPMPQAVLVALNDWLGARRLESAVAALSALADPVPDEKVFTLRRPVSIGDLAFSEITLRALKAGEITAARKKGHPADMAPFLISTVGGVPPAVVDQLHAFDFKAMDDYLSHFF